MSGIHIKHHQGLIFVLVSFVNLVREHVKYLLVNLVLLLKQHSHLSHGQTGLQFVPHILGLGLAVLEGAGREEFLDQVTSDNLCDYWPELWLGASKGTSPA